jgi:histidine triad (HIT) family protein
VPGHTLVVPKNHHPYIFDISDAEYNKLLIATKFIAEKLKGFTGKNRICVIIEGFAVDHAHVHLIPANDPAEFGLPAMPGNMDELADLQSKLVKAINKN